MLNFFLIKDQSIEAINIVLYYIHIQIVIVLERLFYQ